METKVTRERLLTFLLETPMFEKLVPSEIMEIIHIQGCRRSYQAGRNGREKDSRAWAAGLLW
jgi:hypothetical protein